MSALFTPGVNGSPADVTQYNGNWDLLEGSFADRGNYLISGLAVTAGAGLAVSVALGIASIGGRVTVAGSFSIAGLTPSTTNHLYLLQNGTGTANTTGTQPALSAKLGTCVTGASSVSSVSQTRSSGCQQQVRTENLVPGGPGGGQPASINLAGWAAAAADSVTVYGVLPAGAVPASVTGDVTLTPTTNARNLITPTAGSIGLGITQAASQTAQLLYIQSNVGVGWFVVDANGQVLLGDGKNIAVGTSTGTKIGTATSQKLGFFNAAPIVQPAATTDLRQALINLGLYATGGKTPLNLNGGDLQCEYADLASTIAGTTGNDNLLTFHRHLSSGTVAGGFGSHLLFRADDSANTEVDQGRLRCQWNVATAGATVSQLELWAASAGSTVMGLSVDGLGVVTVPGSFSHTGAAGSKKIGYFAATPVIQQANASQAAITAVTDANAKSALQALYNLLLAYGLAPATA